MEYTSNYNLNKMESNDFFKIKDFNTNWDKVDTELSACSKTANGIKKSIDDEFNESQNYEIGDTCIYNNTLFRFVKTSITSVFNSDSTYSTGDYVSYEDTIYVFTSDKSAGEWDSSLVEKSNIAKTAGAWNESIVESFSLMDTVSELNSKLGGEEMNELYYGSIAEREALAEAITSKGVSTNTSDSLSTMAENILNIVTDSTPKLIASRYTTDSSAFTASNLVVGKKYLLIVDGSTTRGTGTTNPELSSATGFTYSKVFGSVVSGNCGYIGYLITANATVISAVKSGHCLYWSLLSL